MSSSYGGGVVVVLYILIFFDVIYFLIVVVLVVACDTHNGSNFDALLFCVDGVNLILSSLRLFSWL